jgi:hypothetical protein
MRYRIITEAKNKIANAVFISGATRTGTSMMARLIYSLDKVECFHEPAFLYSFFYTIDAIPEDQWKILLESFVYEELLLSALAGRRLNFNEHDESCVFHSKPREEIAERLSRTHRHQELVPRSLAHRLAFKMPETVPQLEYLRRYYPQMTFLVMLRRPESVIASLIERGWYSERQMKGRGGEWLFRNARSDLNIPPWVPDHLIDEFVRTSEADRCAMCYIEQYRHLVSRRDCLIVDFDHLMWQPLSYFTSVTEALGEQFGPLTPKLLESVREPPKNRAIPLGEISPDRSKQMIEIYDNCSALALAREQGKAHHVPA